MIGRLAVVLSLIGLVGCAGMMSDDVYSDGETLAGDFTGNTVSARFDDGRPFCAFHAADGTLTGRIEDMFSGLWSIQGDQICYAYDDGRNECRHANIFRDRVTFTDPNDGSMIARGRLMRGDKCS